MLKDVGGGFPKLLNYPTSSSDVAASFRPSLPGKRPHLLNSAPVCKLSFVLYIYSKVRKMTSWWHHQGNFLRQRSSRTKEDIIYNSYYRLSRINQTMAVKLVESLLKRLYWTAAPLNFPSHKSRLLFWLLSCHFPPSSLWHGVRLPWHPAGYSCRVWQWV